MSNYELISYKQFPESDDPKEKYNPLAFAKVRIDRKDVKYFIEKKTKDGGRFWCAPSFSITLNGKTEWFPAHKMDSDCDNEMLIDFVKDSVRKLNGNQIATSGSIQQDIKQAMSGGTENENLPF